MLTFPSTVIHQSKLKYSESDRKHRFLTYIALYPNTGSVQGKDLSAKAQTNARAGSFSGKKWDEDIVEDILENSFAIVLNLNNRAAFDIGKTPEDDFGFIESFEGIGGIDEQID